VRQTAERASQDGKDFDFEHRLLMPDSSIKHVRVVAKTSAAGLLTLLNDILDFSKMEQKKLDIAPIVFSLRTSLADLLKPLAFQAGQKGIEVTSQIMPDVPDVIVGDAGRLQQILTNLIGNAIKFTEQGRILVRIEGEPSPEDSFMLRCLVTDTGIGIPKDQQQFIFEAFRQADSSTTRRYGGTGLGLAISTHLVGLLGGRISVESEEGEGSTFAFTIPVGLGASDEPAVPAAADSHATVVASEVPVPAAGPAPAAAAVRPRILLAEDNSVNQLVAGRMLEKKGFDVQIAVNGQEAVDWLDRARFDLILMDVQMPVMGGFEATAAIRAREANQGGHIPIVAMTAHAMKGDRERCLAAGMDGYLPKPISAESLLALVGKLAVNSRAIDAAFVA
jgi:CheY-like chemotaxis protein